VNASHRIEDGAPAADADPRGGVTAFADAIAALVGARGLDDALHSVAWHAGRLFDAPYATAALVDADANVATQRSIGGRLPPAGDDEALCEVAADGNPILVVDPAGNASPEGAPFLAAGYRSRLALPLLDHGRVAGALTLYGTDARLFDGMEAVSEAYARAAGSVLGEICRGEGEGEAGPEWLNRHIVTEVAQPLVVVDSECRVLRFSRAFGTMFAPACTGASLSELFDPPGLTDILEEVARTGTPARDAEITDDGSRNDRENASSDAITYQVSVSRLPTAAGDALLLLTVDDVTERKAQQAGLMEKGRIVAVGEMAAGVAHELNNPLTAVLGFSELLLKQDVDDVMRRDLEAIAAEAHRAGRVVDSLLSFARRHRSETRPFSAAESVQRVLDARSYECRVNNVEVVTYFDPSAPRTMADLHAMEQVFLNLLNNGIQAVASGGGGGTITVGAVAVDGNLRISFTDDGPGIPPEIMPKLFDPFFTTKPAGQGTGLGLSICYGIVHQHNGTIRAESPPGRGATFVVELPVVPVEEEPEADQPIPDAEPATYTMLRILAVDDESALTELLARALTSYGHEVDIATEGAEALRMIHLTDYDAIILDLKMPGLGGMDVYRALQGMRPEMTGRILFATGDIVTPGSREFLSSTGARVLYKPFSLDDLRRHMDAFALAKEERLANARAPEHRGQGTDATHVAP